MIWGDRPQGGGPAQAISPEALRRRQAEFSRPTRIARAKRFHGHVLEVLKRKRALKDHAIERVVFNAITKQAVSEAMKHPRQIDGALVDAYMARRALDICRLYASPVLWRKLGPARVPPGVCSRWRCGWSATASSKSRNRAREYWSLVATLATARGETFEARLVGADGKKIQRLRYRHRRGSR